MADPEKTRLSRLIQLVAAGGLGGLLVFGDLARDSFTESNRWLRPIFVTLISVAGVLLGFASGKLDKYAPPAERGAVKRYRAALVAIALAGCTLLAAAWWSAVAPAETTQKVTVVPAQTATLSPDCSECGSVTDSGVGSAP